MARSFNPMRFSSPTALFAGFFLLRLFAYIFPPATPLYPAHFMNHVLAALFAFLVGYLLWKKDERGYMLAAGEMILGGGGGFLSLGSVSLRTVLLFVCLSFFFFNEWREKKLSALFTNDKPAGIAVGLLLLAAAAAALRGYALGHNPAMIFSDFLPYIFLLYYFPLRGLLLSPVFRQFAARAIIVAAIANAVFILFSFIGFSSGFFALQGGYYHWYRDVALGKITDLGFNFFRLILDDGLLLVPALIYFLYKLMEKNARYGGAAAASLIILSINLTRAYMLALVAGALALWRKRYHGRWLFFVAASTVVFLISFTILNLATSRGQSAGWQIFGWRLNSIVAPSQEESSLSRLLLLPKIMEKIKSRPWLGQGLGDTVTVWSPVLKKEITTPHFDWGYLEIWAEMGVYGTLAWLVFIILLLRRLFRFEVPPATLAILIAFLVINITSPALFHVLGIITLAALLAESSKNDKISFDA